MPVLERAKAVRKLLNIIWQSTQGWLGHVLRNENLLHDIRGENEG